MARPQRSFFHSLPTADLFWIAGGVALLVAPLWGIAMAKIVTPGRIPGFLMWCVFGGLTGMFWFLGSSYRRLFFIPAVAFNVFVAFGGYYFERRALATGSWFGPGTITPVPTAEGLLMLGMLIAAFIMIMGFVGRVATPHMRMVTQLAVASDIHATLVRPIERRVGHFSISARSDASSTMGGDLVDLVEHDECIDLVLADVTGHGVRAGVVMALAKGVINAHLKASTDLALAVSNINADLSRLIDPMMFVTAVFVRIDKHENGRAVAVVAGHPPLLHHAAGGVRAIESSGMPLGIDATGTYEAVPLQLGRGDRLWLYSDGLTEAQDPSGRELGIAGLQRYLESSASRSPAEQLSAVLGFIPNNPKVEADDRSLAIVAMIPTSGDGAPA